MNVYINNDYVSDYIIIKINNKVIFKLQIPEVGFTKLRSVKIYKVCTVQCTYVCVHIHESYATILSILLRVKLH